MRILFLQDHLRLGGTEKQTTALAKIGKEIGHQTGLVVFRPGGVLQLQAAKLDFFKELQPFNSRIDEWAPGLKAHIRKFQPDAVVFMGKVAHIHLRKIRRSFPEITTIATYRSGKKPVRYYVRALQNAHGIITNSRNSCDHLSTVLAPYDIPITTIHNGCLVEPNSQALEATNTKRLKLLCVAMFRPQKNQKELLEILAKLPKNLDWECTFSGKGKTLSSCKQLTGQLNLEDRVRFTWNPDPYELYARHNVAVLTSDKEGLPNCLIEAQCSGLPIIAYLVNGVKECFEEGVSGFGIPFGNQAAFSDALALLGNDRKRRIQMAASAKEFGEAHFDFRKQSETFFQDVEFFHAGNRLA
ncbi:MAG: hypothetical protein CMI18_03695 [Opitutaceae bacterium]|nr:hypothetical protein [Opitutaceae bacterium]|tara:strand:- start:432 stop:1499 length:1068 start_codon:yes stop_codon:yes gene_type:complete